MKVCSNCGTAETCKWYSGPICNSCHGKAFRAKNPDYHRKYQQKQYAISEAFRIKDSERKKKLYEAQYERIIEKRRLYQQERLKTDPLFKLKRNLRSRLNKAVQFGYKAGSAVDDLGCSIEELKIYLELRFQPGMTWNNYGDWHIDHVKPLASFDITDPDQVKQACHYTNLQPLWKEDNLRKGDK